MQRGFVRIVGNWVVSVGFHLSHLRALLQRDLAKKKTKHDNNRFADREDLMHAVCVGFSRGCL